MSPLQRAAFNAIRDAPAPISLHDLSAQLGASKSAVKARLQRARSVLVDDPIESIGFGYDCRYRWRA